MNELKIYSARFLCLTWKTDFDFAVGKRMTRNLPLLKTSHSKQHSGLQLLALFV